LPARPLQTLDERCRALEARWHEEIPISAAMGVGVQAFDGERLRVQAALAPNVNVHGTVFAGSLFSVAALCGWGLVYLQLLEQHIDAAILFVDGRIRCLAPATADVTAQADWGATAAATLTALPERGRGRIVLDARVICQETLVAEFQGEYAVRVPRTQ
jgi:thioesterase domain-containing protein